MDDVNLSRQFLDSAGHDLIVQSDGPHRAHDPVREAQLPSRQRGRNSHARGNRPGNRGRENQHLGSRRRQAVHLLPGRIADPVRTQPEREAVHHPHALISVAHCFCFTKPSLLPALRTNRAVLLPWFRWAVISLRCGESGCELLFGLAPPRFEPSLSCLEGCHGNAGQQGEQAHHHLSHIVNTEVRHHIGKQV